MKKSVRALICALMLAALAALIIGAAKRDGDAIYENTLRLHVVASSDSEEDQALKLKVRDCVLALLSEPIGECASAREAKELLGDGARREMIEAAAEKVIADEGFDYPVSVELREGEVFPRKSYGSATLPAGRYDALRVTIGEGEGHNWWCVLYPPLCMTLSCSDSDTDTGGEEEKLAAAGFTPGQVALITGSSPGDDGGGGRMKIKLRIVEIVEALFDKIAPGRNRKETY